MATIILSKKAAKEFAHLPQKDKKKIFKKLSFLKENPLLGKALMGKLKGPFSLQAWPYRIIYEVQKSKVVVIHRIAHRQRSYKN